MKQMKKEEDVDEGITLGTWVKVSLHVGWRLICATLPGGRRLIRRPPVDLGKVCCGDCSLSPTAWPGGQAAAQDDDDDGKIGTKRQEFFNLILFIRDITNKNLVITPPTFMNAHMQRRWTLAHPWGTQLGHERARSLRRRRVSALQRQTRTRAPMDGP